MGSRESSPTVAARVAQGVALLGDGADLEEAYRYLLWRAVGPLPRTLLFVMLNPSTADATQDDPTIRRCRRFAQREGAGRLVVANVFAWRASDPATLRILRGREDIVGDRNDAAIRDAAIAADVIVLAWGAVPAWARPRADQVRRIIEGVASDRLYVLGRTQDGSPRHPLYVRGDAVLLPC